ARPLRMLLSMQMIVAFAAGATVMFYFQRSWFPVITTTIEQLPRQARWDHRLLQWPTQPKPAALAHNPLAAIVLDWSLSGRAGQLSDVQVEFGSTHWRVRSLLGYSEFHYAEGRFELENAIVKPAWEAWKPAGLAFVGITAAIGIFCSWILLATLGAPIAKLIGFFANRDLSLGQAWKLCGAALMPGAIVFTIALVLYSILRLNLFGLLLAFVIHLSLDLFYMLLAPCRLPKKAAIASPLIPPANPFRSPNTEA
ncbi:MAG: hypothetical protein JWM99_1222, partial [Verrucomicrobiales bacterium]|nr:hypothetical protein [Verrucomicrobiales bacterium]